MEKQELLYQLNDRVVEILHDVYHWTPETEEDCEAVNAAVLEIADVISAVVKDELTR